MSKDDILKLWWIWLNDEVSDFFNEIVFDKQINQAGVPRPAPPFMSIDIISGPTPKGFDWRQYKNQDVGDDTLVSAGPRGFTINLKAFGGGGEEALALIQNLLDHPITLENFTRPANIGIVDRGNVVDLTQYLESSNEKRHSLDIQFAIQSEYEAPFPYIAKVRVKGDDTEGELDNDVTIIKEE